MIASQVERLAEDDLAAAACMFRSLGDPNRLAILRHLALGEHRVVDLVSHLGLAQSTVSAHLACLRDCGLVTSRPQGRGSRGLQRSHQPVAVPPSTATGP